MLIFQHEKFLDIILQLGFINCLEIVLTSCDLSTLLLLYLTEVQSSYSYNKVQIRLYMLFFLVVIS